MEGIGERSHPIHPYLEGLKAFNEGKVMKIILKYFPIDPQRGFFDSVEDIRGLSKTDQMGKFVLLRPTWKATLTSTT